MPRGRASSVLTLRVPPELERRIARAARARRRSKSEVLREALVSAFGQDEPGTDPETEARRQSLLVSGRASEKDVLEFNVRAADVKGWR